MRIVAPAKVNLSLRIRGRDPNGYHPLLSLVQAVEPFDILDFELAADDDLQIEGIRMPAGDDNLIWKALRASVPDRRRGLHVRLVKEIPTAAGLGGGSSDAAAALLAAGRLFGASWSPETASSVGADVPFFRTGGLARMEGYGEVLTLLGPADGYHLVLVVPPFDLATPAVYAAWDDLDGPSSFEIGGTDLPPALRPHGPLTNHLYPAAVSLSPTLDDWRAELAGRWSRPVLMSGSGPSLFAFFGSPDEAVEAADLIPAGARFGRPVGPIDHGVKVVEDA